MPVARRFAQGTTVTLDKTLLEIQTLLRKKGAKKVSVQYSDDACAVLCELCDRVLKFTISLTGARDEAEKRRRWRCMLMTIRGRFTELAEEMGVFEEIFLANIVVNPEGHTVYETLAGRLPTITSLPTLAERN